MTDRIVTVDEAVVVPPARRSFKQVAGVLTPEGALVEEARMLRGWSNLLRPPPMPEPEALDGARLEGTWLYAGLLFDSFGHFLTESASRFWAAHDAEVRGMVWLPKQPRRPATIDGWQADLLDAWGLGGLEHAIPRRPVRVERLVVPTQGMGLGDGVTGTPAMQAAVVRHFAHAIPPDGPRRLYVSRSRFGAHNGGLLSEKRIEALLAAEGYEIFFPEDHDVATQIAHYKAAERAVFCDGSALHLYAYVARYAQHCAILARRHMWTETPATHVAALTGRAPLVPDTVRTPWVPDDGVPRRGVVFAEHDMPALGRTLAEDGFVERPEAWTDASEGEVAAELDALLPGVPFKPAE